MIVGSLVRGLSVRDVESLCEEAGLGRTSKATVAGICSELHERFEAFCRRDLYETRLVVLFLDAIYLPVRPSGPKEGVMCAWGFTENGEGALVCVRLGAREAKDDRLELGRDLATRGLAAPGLIVADGAPGLTLGIEELWPRADRQHSAVHRLRNPQAKLPKSEHDRVRRAYAVEGRRLGSDSWRNFCPRRLFLAKGPRSCKFLAATGAGRTLADGRYPIPGE